MTAIYYLQGGLALILQVFVLNAMLRTGTRRYWLLLLYVISLFLSTAVLMLFSLSGPSGWSRGAFRFFWVSEVVQQALVYCTIISFIHQRLSAEQARAPVTRWLIVGAATVLLSILAIHKTDGMSAWMTPASRDLSFVATILNLILWTVLLRDPRRNQRLLMVSGGLGVQLAGSAIGQGLRVLWEVSRVFATLGNVVISATYLLSLYIIYRAFAQPEPLQKESALSEPLGGSKL